MAKSKLSDILSVGASKTERPPILRLEIEKELLNAVERISYVMANLDPASSESFTSLETIARGAAEEISGGIVTAAKILAEAINNLSERKR